MTCKDCLYHDKCYSRIVLFIGEDTMGKQYQDIEKRCKDFKEKSKYIEIPCKIGDAIYEVKQFIKSYQKRYPHRRGYILKAVVNGIHIHTSKTYKNNEVEHAYLTCESPIQSGYFCRYLLNKQEEKFLFSKDIYFTLEEAEERLKELNDENT